MKLSATSLSKCLPTALEAAARFVCPASPVEHRKRVPPVAAHAGLGTLRAGPSKIWTVRYLKAYNYPELQTCKSESQGDICLHLEYPLSTSVQDEGP